MRMLHNGSGRASLRRTAAAVTVLAGLAALLAWTPASEAMQIAGLRRPTLIVTASRLGTFYPGSTQWIRVSIANPHRFPIRVTGVKGTLTSTSRRGCRAVATNLTIGRYRGALPLRVPAHTRRRGGYLAVRMPHSVSPSCRQATFTIKLTGRATKEAR